MVKINELRGIMVSKGITQKELAEKLGVSEKTLCSRMKKGVFGSDEIYDLIKILEIRNPLVIFFADDVAQ